MGGPQNPEKRRFGSKRKREKSQARSNRIQVGPQDHADRQRPNQTKNYRRRGQDPLRINLSKHRHNERSLVQGRVHQPTLGIYGLRVFGNLPQTRFPPRKNKKP